MEEDATRESSRASAWGTHFDHFAVQTIRYKTVEGEGVLLDVMVPENVRGGRRPVNFHFHGGYLVMGARNMVKITPPRILQHAQDEGLVLVSADHRLLPESSAADAVEDIEAMWQWSVAELDRTVCQMTGGTAGADMSKVLVSGESAGGYLAIQLALSHPTAIRAVIATYPMIDLRSPSYSEARIRPVGGHPQYPRQIIDDHLDQLPDGRHPTTRDVNATSDALAYAMLQHGRYLDYFGHERRLFPIERMQDDVQLARQFPYLWLQHGTADTEVPIEGSRTFVDKLKHLHPRAAMRYVELKAMGHAAPSEVYLMTSGEWRKGLESINQILHGDENGQEWSNARKVASWQESSMGHLDDHSARESRY